jgi:hypothetical protein
MIFCVKIVFADYTKTVVTKLGGTKRLPEQCRDDGRGTGFATANRISNVKSRVLNNWELRGLLGKREAETTDWRQLRKYKPNKSSSSVWMVTYIDFIVLRVFSKPVVGQLLVAYIAGQLKSKKITRSPRFGILRVGWWHPHLRILYINILQGEEQTILINNNNQL